MKTRSGEEDRRRGVTRVTIPVSGRSGTLSLGSGLRLQKITGSRLTLLLVFAEIFVSSLTRERICSTYLMAEITRKSLRSQPK